MTPASRNATINLHGTAIALDGKAVLLRGRAGAGKSDLALRCIGAHPGPLVPHQPILVADDRVVAEASGGALRLASPVAIAGLLEVRGIGIVGVPFVAEARLLLVADLVEPSLIERLPEPMQPAVILGVSVARITIAPFEAAAPLKLLLALSAAIAAEGQG